MFYLKLKMLKILNTYIEPVPFWFYLDMLLQQKIKVQPDVNTCFINYSHRVLFYPAMNRTESGSWI